MIHLSLSTEWVTKRNLFYINDFSIINNEIYFCTSTESENADASECYAFKFYKSSSMTYIGIPIKVTLGEYLDTKENILSEELIDIDRDFDNYCHMFSTLLTHLNVKSCVFLETLEPMITKKIKNDGFKYFFVSENNIHAYITVDIVIDFIIEPGLCFEETGYTTVTIKDVIIRNRNHDMIRSVSSDEQDVFVLGIYNNNTSLEELLSRDGVESLFENAILDRFDNIKNKQKD